ncbi:asparagine synthase (glutamine-hydrolyzing) [Lysobacter soli]|uniref:asparagine synthase (glutamine-hydrolyzing) n=1 Tax=Lysobacter soli TaxID=453783 RepID=UPI0012EE0386|nr:asparagine synthase (glutamine-hydrolyzing) [Lysobacter soli]QGW64064.1 asparagine synthase (glutamine-hydrolyzing) [Lysobacter soli]
MCGIAGFIGRGDGSTLKRMTDRIAHRGPDADGFLVDAANAVFLGHRRLSILDIAGGVQPMSTTDGAISIVFNGEIYNFHELRIELERLGAVFQTDHSDTEVLLHAWRHWREAMFEKLNGMWAFALLDRERKELILSRDRFGKKPLFYHAGSNSFAFSSELISLRAHPEVPAALSERALRKYYAYGFVPAPLTFIEGVNKLPGGHWMRVDLDTLSTRTQRYWEYQPEPFQERPAGIEDRWAEELLAKLGAAVDRRLVADVPVGSFLSGGIDSSAVSALAIRKLGRDRLKTFSIGFEEASFDETAYARMVASHLGAEHHVERLSIQRALDILPDVLSRFDEPVADASILPTYLLCQHARRHVTVALGGDGADELFAGYDPFKALRYARLYERMVPRPIHKAISMLAGRLPVSHGYMSLDFKIKRTLGGLNHDPRLWLPVWMAPIAPSEMEALHRKPVDLEDVFSEAIELWEGCAEANDIDRTIAFYINLYLQDDILVKVDRSSMLHSLEVRAPFLDIDFVDFVRRLPADVKLRQGTTKWLLKRAVAPLLPGEILARRKQGFGVPVGAWFRDDLLPAHTHSSGYNEAFWAQRLSSHRSRRRDERLFLWSDWLLRGSHLYG